MTALIAASSLLTCLGNGEQTFVSLLKGITGATPLRHPIPGPVNVEVGYHIPGRDPDGYAADLLTTCAAEAVRQAGPQLRGRKIAAIVGTGLRELAAVERFALNGEPLEPHRLAFDAAMAQAVPGLTDVITIANACSAGGHALALAQDMVESGEADAVVVGATDVMTTSMLAMIGRVAAEPTEQVRPFDRDRPGVLLGEGAAAVVVVGEDWAGPRLGRLLATGLSCDAFHETAPDVDGLCRAMADAFARAGRATHEVDLVLAHATGTSLNDPAECAALQRVLHDADPLVTGIKGAVGHLSGAAALANVDVALRCLERGEVPPVVGLREVLPEAGRLRIIKELPVSHQPRLIQANAFGFGGVNAVTLLEAA